MKFMKNVASELPNIRLILAASGQAVGTKMGTQARIN